MRIRKHAARILSSLSIPAQSCAVAAASAGAGVREVEMHVCQLNQSPWDAMDFALPGDASLYDYKEMEDVEEEKSFVEGATWTGQREEGPAAAFSDVSGTDAKQTALRRQVKVEEKAKGAEGEEGKTERKAKAKTRSRIHDIKKVKRKTTTSCGTSEGAEKGKSTLEVGCAASATAALQTCKKSDGKGWSCKRVAQHPHSFCEYHLTQFRSYYSNGDSPVLALEQQQHSFPKEDGGGIVAKQTAAFIPDKKSNMKRTKIKKNTERSIDCKTSRMSSNNVDAINRRKKKPTPSDFYYYYSGFGPCWGKRSRSGGGAHRDGGEREWSAVDAGSGDAARDNVCDGAPVPMVHDQAPDDLDDDDEIDDVDGLRDYEGDDVVVGKRRGRKPIKARSLKSLL